MAYLKNIEKMFEETRLDKTKKFFRKKARQFFEYNRYDKDKKLKSCLKYLTYPLALVTLTPIKYALAGIIIGKYFGCGNNEIKITSKKESEIIQDSAQKSLEYPKEGHKSKTFNLYRNRIED